MRRNLLAVAMAFGAMTAPAQSQQPRQLHTNEAYVDEATQTSTLAITDPLAVFAFVLDSLPERVNVYPTAILSVVGGFRPRVTGRARVLKVGPGVSIEPPVPVEVEVPESGADAALAGEIEAAIRSVLTFRAGVRLVPESQFGEAGYKTRLTVPQP